MTPRLILMCGLPGAGKTTVARRLAADIPAVRLCPDEWLTGLGVDLHDESMRDRLESVFWLHAQELLRLGQSVILENGFWSRSERDEKRLAARALGVAVELRYLPASLEELCRRVSARGGVVLTRAMLEEYAGCFQAPDQAELDRFDPPPTSAIGIE